MRQKALRNKLQKAEKSDAQARAGAAAERVQEAMSSLSDNDMAAWWWAMAQDSGRALCGDPAGMDEIGARGARRWAESGMPDALPDLYNEYDSGPLPMTEAPDPVKFLAHRQKNIQAAVGRLLRTHGDPREGARA